MARVLSCVMARAPHRPGAVWSKKRLVLLSLTCSHVLRKFSHRAYLTGELVRCPDCEKAADRSAVRLPLESETA